MPRKNVHPFTEVLIRERTNWGITQKVLATVIGRSDTVVSDMETGRGAPEERLRNLAVALSFFGYDIVLVRRELTEEERKTIEAAREASYE